MKSARLAAAVAVAALVVSALTACQPRVGAAAYVGSTKITESDVKDYVAVSVPPATGSASASPTAAPANRNSQVLSLLIATQLFDRALAVAPGGSPDANRLEAARSDFLASRNNATMSDVETEVRRVGYKTPFAQVYVDANAKFSLLAEAYADSDGAVVIANVRKLNVKVDVSPRYGTWQPDQLSLSDGPTLPSYLQLAPTTSPALNAAG